MVGIVVAVIVLFAPSTTSDTALVELVAGDVPATAIYSLALVGVIAFGIWYVVSEYRGSNTKEQ